MQRSNLKRSILPLWLLSTLVLASSCGKKYTPISSNEVAAATKPKPLAQLLPAEIALKLPEEGEGVNVPVTAAVQPTEEQQQQTVSSIQPVSNNSSNSQQQSEENLEEETDWKKSEAEKDPISITEIEYFFSLFSSFFVDSADQSTAAAD